jgi:hypothetical protein
MAGGFRSDEPAKFRRTSVSNPDLRRCRCRTIRSARSGAAVDGRAGDDRRFPCEGRSMQTNRSGSRESRARSATCRPSFSEAASVLSASSSRSGLSTISVCFPEADRPLSTLLGQSYTKRADPLDYINTREGQLSRVCGTFRRMRAKSRRPVSDALLLQRF